MNPTIGADMLTDEQIERLAQTHLTAGDDGEVFGVVKFARALLARRPAAIDKQGAEAKAADFMVAARNAQMFQDVRELISTFTDPKANCPGRNLEAQRVLPLLDAFLGEGYTGRVLSFKRALERAESEGPEFEDGPDESGFKGPRPWNGFQDDKQPLTDHRIWEIADLVWQRKSITTDRGFELDFAHEVIAAALHEVRAASTSANVAQGAAIPDGWMLVPKKRGTKPLSELIIAASLACIENRLLDHDDRRELAEYADQLQNTRSNQPDARLCDRIICAHLGKCSNDDAAQWLKCKARENSANVACKPAAFDQADMTMLIKRMQDYCDSLAPPIARGLMAEAVRALRALTAAQSASGDTK